MIKKFVLGFVSLGLMGAVAQATSYTGNAATGFGGTLGNGTLTFTQSGSTINGTFAAGAAFNDGLVIYIDSAAGGASVISSGAGFTDSADANRGAITNRGLNTLNLPFAADFALSLSPVQGPFGGIWSLTGSGSNLPFVTSVNLLPLNNATGPYTFSFTLANIGLTAGQSFNFVATYLNGTNAFLSNETLSGTTGLGATNPGTPSTVTLVGSQVFSTTAVPEPATVLLVGPALLSGMFFIRRRRS